jgi:hypothetical protein
MGTRSSTPDLFFVCIKECQSRAHIFGGRGVRRFNKLPSSTSQTHVCISFMRQRANCRVPPPSAQGCAWSCLPSCDLHWRHYVQSCSAAQAATAEQSAVSMIRFSPCGQINHVVVGHNALGTFKSIRRRFACRGQVATCDSALHCGPIPGAACAVVFGPEPDRRLEPVCA